MLLRDKCLSEEENTLFITVRRGGGGGNQGIILLLSLQDRGGEEKVQEVKRESFSFKKKVKQGIEEKGLNGGEEVLLLCKDEEIEEKYKRYHCRGRIRRKMGGITGFYHMDKWMGSKEERK